MASQSLIFFFFFFVLLSFSPLIISVAGKSSDGFGRMLNPDLLGIKKEKLSHFKFYWHDIVSGKNPSNVIVINSTANSNTYFGRTAMIDDPLTLGPELSSKWVGKAQGFYASADQTETGLLMAMNFVFTEGKYNGSTIMILGRNAVMNKVREMPVVGGSGLFRFARGYVEARTYKLSPKTGDATVEYNVYVLHY